MKIKSTIRIGTVLIALTSCNKPIEQKPTNYQYTDLTTADTVSKPLLIAVTDEEFLQYGARVAYISVAGDTVIPFGKYSYFGTDTLIYFANVMEHPNDSTYGRLMGINRDQKVLFDGMMFDNGPEPFNEGFVRVTRNGKMGYANQYGQVVIPCIYDFAYGFKDGVAEVTFKANWEHFDEEHSKVTSDEWFTIDKRGRKLTK